MGNLGFSSEKMWGKWKKVGFLGFRFLFLTVWIGRKQSLSLIEFSTANLVLLR